METTRTFPRTLAEAFPNDPEYRTQYACAVEIVVKQRFYLNEFLVFTAVCVAIGYLLGKMY
jgi:hypothetical protein